MQGRIGRIGRIFRHLFVWPGAAARRFPPATMDRVEQRIAAGERAHGGEIRIAIESALAPSAIWSGLDPRARALEVFGALRVWDTEANNGVLVYLLLADQAVEIVADRGAHARVAPEVWEQACRTLADACRSRRDEAGMLEAVDLLNRALAEAFPAASGNPDELPNRPSLL